MYREIVFAHRAPCAAKNISLSQDLGLYGLRSDIMNDFVHSNNIRELLRAKSSGT